MAQKNWVPSEDNLLGIIKNGAFVEGQVQRDRTPKATVRTVGQSTMKNPVSIAVNGGYWGDDVTPWVVRSVDGITRQFLDPTWDDRSMRSTTVQSFPKIRTSTVLF